MTERTHHHVKAEPDKASPGRAVQSAVGLYINRIIEAGRPDILAPIPPTAIDRLREAVILTATLAKVDGRRFEDKLCARNFW